MSSPELVSRAWVLLLALTAALVAVAGLRVPCRRWLGAERAFLLWWLAPLSMLVSQMPHAAGNIMGPLPPLVLVVTTAVAATGTPVPLGHHLLWQDAAVAIWAIGVIVGVIVSCVAQRRYQRVLGRGNVVLCMDRRWAVCQATSDDVGPATVGAWNPRIVVPADFDRRYSKEEQSLILAHEAAHASRRDGWWALWARALLVGCWFHPLAWWAYGAFRLDQELACDAFVMKHHHRQRRIYAQAMLKTQSATLTLPVGCTWSPRHPITERVAMLKQLPPGRTRRFAGHVAMLLAAAMVAGGVYATTDTTNAPGSKHRLKIELAVNGQPARLHADVCLEDGHHYGTTQGGVEPLAPWEVTLGVAPGPDHMLEIQATISGGTLKGPAHPFVRVMPGQTAGIQVGERVMGKDGKELDRTLKMELTPSTGC